MKTLRLTVALLLALALGACGGGGDDDDARDVADLSAKALSLEDLPDGWAEDRSEDDDSDDDPECLRDVEDPLEADTTGEAEVDFMMGAGTPALSEGLYQASSAAAVTKGIDAIVAALDGCTTFEQRGDDGEEITGQIGRVSVPEVVGVDRQESYQMTLASGGITAAAGLLFLQVDTYIIALSYVDLGSLDTVTLTDFAQLAVAKLEGEAPPEGGPTEGDPEDTTTTEDAGPVEPVGALESEYLEGNVDPDYAEGEPGQLSVVAIGEAHPDTGRVPFVVRNNTTSPRNLEATGRVTEGGELVSTGDTSLIEPSVVGPGELAFGSIEFDSTPGPDAEVEIEVTGDEPNDFDLVPLVVGDVNLVEGTRIVGEVQGADIDVAGAGAYALCVAEDGTPQRIIEGYIDGDDVAAGGTATFTIDLEEAECPSFLVASSGFGRE